MRTYYIIPEVRAIADLIPPGELTPGWAISRINVPAKHRGNGYGSKLLSLILADADSENVVLWLEVHASGGLSYVDLVSWYQRHGFAGDAYSYLIRRQPERKGNVRSHQGSYSSNGDDTTRAHVSPVLHTGDKP